MLTKEMIRRMSYEFEQVFRMGEGVTKESDFFEKEVKGF